MEIKHSYSPPPNWDELVFRFGVKWGDVVVTYGETIHHEAPMSPDLLAHEMVHVRQQTQFGVEEWWRKYLSEPYFRLSQEVEAYREQLRFIKTEYADRNKIFKHHDRLARDLSGQVYGKICTYDQAFKLIGLTMSLKEFFSNGE